MPSTVNLPSRQISRTYQDPLELIWLQTADELSIRVQRDPHVFATWDGAGVLRIGTNDTLDPDDCLAQMIFHELCHAIVEGDVGWAQVDWGLDYDDPRHREREYACLRLQAALADCYGLRNFFAATTDFRAYYDQLPDDPLKSDGDPAAEIANTAWAEANSARWAAVHRALQATRAIADALTSEVPPSSLWSQAFPTS